MNWSTGERMSLGDKWGEATSSECLMSKFYERLVNIVARLNNILEIDPSVIEKNHKL